MESDRSMALIAISIVAVLAMAPVFALADNPRDVFEGEVTEVGSFDSYVVSITGKDLLDAGHTYGDRFRVEIGDHTFDALFFDFYSGTLLYQPYVSTSLDESEPLSIGIYSGSMATKFPVPVGGKVKLTFVEKTDFLDKYPRIRGGYTFERQDYNSDAEFSNFRQITLGNMTMCRTSDATGGLTTGLERAEYVNRFFQDYNVGYYVHIGITEEVLDLRAEILKRTDGFYRPVIDLYDSGNIHACWCNADFVTDADSYRVPLEKIIDETMKGKEVCLSCAHGKDRTGIIMIWLEAIAGWSTEDIMEDYCLSFCNFYKIEKGSEEYKAMEKDYFGRLVILTAHPELSNDPLSIEWDKYDYRDVDIKKASEKFLLQNVGLSQEKLDELKSLMGV